MQKEREMRHAVKHGRPLLPFPPSPERDRSRPIRSEGLDERTISRIGSASCECWKFIYIL